VGFSPIGISHITQRLGLNFDNSTSSQEEKFMWVIRKFTEIPYSWSEEERSEIEEEAVPIPD